MKRLCLTLVLFCGCFAQPPTRPCPSGSCGKLDPGPSPSPDAPPSEKKQTEAIVKDDYKRNLADSAELVRLAEELKNELENGDKYVVSVKAMKNAEDIEKLAHNIKNRLKRY